MGHCVYRWVGKEGEGLDASGVWVSEPPRATTVQPRGVGRGVQRGWGGEFKFDYHRVTGARSMGARIVRANRRAALSYASLSQQWCHAFGCGILRAHRCPNVGPRHTCPRTSDNVIESPSGPKCKEGGGALEGGFKGGFRYAGVEAGGFGGGN